MKTKKEIIKERQKLSELLKESQDKLKHNLMDIDNVNNSVRLLDKIITLNWVLDEE